MCRIYCEDGYVKDENGCDTCECIPPSPEPPICPEVMCLMHCELGYVVDENGCDTCECIPEPPICPEIMCRMYCEDGYVTDDNGCMTCECNQKPPNYCYTRELWSDEKKEWCCENMDIGCPDCPEVMCRIYCEHGYVKDLNGCDTCQCNPEPPICPDIMCPMSLMCGIGKDDKGCDTCECNIVPPVECQDVLCEMHCDFGFATGDDGCEICQCAEPPACPEIMCAMHCEFGFMEDENGCDVCKCNPGPEDKCCESGWEYGEGECMDSCPGECPIGLTVEGCQLCMCPEDKCCESGWQDGEGECMESCPGECAIGQTQEGCQVCMCPECPPYMCEMHCDHGFATGDDGCEICECNPEPECPPYMCMRYCEHGFAKGEDGCEICECNPGPKCPPYMCLMYCEHGFAKGEDGCEICECNPEPECPLFMCLMHCEHGFATGEDGCARCECAPPPLCDDTEDCEQPDHPCSNASCVDGACRIDTIMCDQPPPCLNGEMPKPIPGECCAFEECTDDCRSDDDCMAPLGFCGDAVCAGGKCDLIEIACGQPEICLNGKMPRPIPGQCCGYEECTDDCTTDDDCIAPPGFCGATTCADGKCDLIEIACAQPEMCPNGEFPNPIPGACCAFEPCPCDTADDCPKSSDLCADPVCMDGICGEVIMDCDQPPTCAGGVPAVPIPNTCCDYEPCPLGVCECPGGGSGQLVGPHADDDGISDGCLCEEDRKRCKNSKQCKKFWNALKSADPCFQQNPVCVKGEGAWGSCQANEIICDVPICPNGQPPVHIPDTCCEFEECVSPCDLSGKQKAQRCKMKSTRDTTCGIRKIKGKGKRCVEVDFVPLPDCGTFDEKECKKGKYRGFCKYIKKRNTCKSLK